MRAIAIRLFENNKYRITCGKAYLGVAFSPRVNTLNPSESTEELLMESVVLTSRIDTKTKAKLDKLSEATRRSKSFLAADAIERYLEVEAWQIKEIKQAIEGADAGDFVSDKEFGKIVKKYAGSVAY